MRPIKLWRSAPFRIAIANAAILAVLMMVSAIILFQDFERRKKARLEHLAEAEFAIFEQALSEHGPRRLIEEVENSIRAYGDQGRFYALFDTSGAPIITNVPRTQFDAFRRGEGASRLCTSPCIVVARRLGSYVMVLSMSETEFTGALKSIYATLLWTSLVVAGASLLIGGLLGAESSRRLSAISETMEAFGAGDSRARVVPSHRGDDIDLLAQDANERLDQIESIMDSLREISSDIAHDLRTPVTRLSISLDELRAQAERDPEVGRGFVQGIEDAQAQARELTATFDAILRLARIENRLDAKNFREVELSALICDLHETFQPIAEDAGYGLEIAEDAPPEGAGPVIQGDRALLSQLLVNLIENAIRHTPEGSRILLSVGPGARLRVEDNGPGIPPNERDKVFRRLFRGEASRTTPGNGLGLALVKAIADLHGAAIELGDAGPGLRVEIVFDNSA